MSIFILAGCGEKKTEKDVKNVFDSMKVIGVEGEEKSKLFSDSNTPNSIKIEYPDNVVEVINLEESNDNLLSKCYMALDIQQSILDNIYNFYEKHNEKFYSIMPTKEYNEKEMEDLYNEAKNLESSLQDFSIQHESFVTSASAGVSDVMISKINIYSYQLNNVIENSFNFIYKFMDMYENYCIENKESTSIEYLNFSIVKTLVNFSYVIYLENVKSFNDAVGKNGVCEVYNIIETNKTKYDFTMFLESFAVSEATINNLNTTSTLYAKTQKTVDEYYYFNEIFEQKLVAYENTYKSFDFYNYNKHRMNLGNGVTYTDYLNTLSQSEKASISLMENFMYTTFLDLYEKVCELTV